MNELCIKYITFINQLEPITSKINNGANEKKIKLFSKKILHIARKEKNKMENRRNT